MSDNTEDILPENEPITPSSNQQPGGEESLHNIKYLPGLYRDWFLDYASYVILERAVPHLHDGLKPVQRRILHSMRRMDDGRYNKVANIIGHSMQFHPHGDASIGDALVGLGQKELLIDMQGNWGNIFTGDSAAAARYIEARLSKFAQDVVFNPKITNWKLSYDGRNKEPITLPVKFPLLLAQGVEGIAVGLASKLLPHNFNELIDCAIAHLKGEKFVLLPDFPTGGFADVTRYNDGLRGGVVRVRAKIAKLDNKTLVIKDLPFGKTTTDLIDSIIKANDKGKIKIKKIDDNTAAEVEILIHLHTGVSPDETIDALYVFTDCEIPISPNSCVIEENTPKFLGVSEILRRNVNRTVELLTAELRIQLGELEEELFWSSLEKIFIENKMYREFEKIEDESQYLPVMNKILDPYRKVLYREIKDTDILKLREIKMGRILKFDAKKADEHIRHLLEGIEEVKNHLANIIPYTINWFIQIKKKYGAGRERKTELRSFEQIEAQQVVIANTKLYANFDDGFVGTGLKKDTFMFDCSDIDDIIVFRKDGAYTISKVSEKAFFGKGIIHVGIFRKNDERTTYNAIYIDGETGISYIKRFPVAGIVRDKEYNITRGVAHSKLLYFSANANGEAEIVKVWLKPRPTLRRTVFEMDFSQVAIKGRSSLGNIVSKHAIHKIQKIEEGISTLGGRKLWFDTVTRRLNEAERGLFLGDFKGADKLLVITQGGQFMLSTFDLSNHFPDDTLIIEKYQRNRIISAVFYDGEENYHYVKRFEVEEISKPQDFIGEHPKSKLISVSLDRYPQLEVTYGKKSKREDEKIDVHEFIGVKGFKARGKRLTTYEFEQVQFIEPLEKEEPEEEMDLLDDKPDSDPFKDGDAYNGEQMSLF